MSHINQYLLPTRLVWHHVNHISWPEVLNNLPTRDEIPLSWSVSIVPELTVKITLMWMTKVYGPLVHVWTDCGLVMQHDDIDLSLTPLKACLATAD